MNPDFEVIGRSWGDCWKHKRQNFFIIFYESQKQQNKPAFFAYRSIEKCRRCDPWTVDNRCVGRFSTLEAAMEQANKEK